LTNIFWRGFSSWVSKPAVSVFMMKLATAIDGPLLRASNGKLRLSCVIPVLLLKEVPGRKTGLLREVPLLYVPDGEDCLLIASNAGQGHLPMWYRNLRETASVSIVTSAHSAAVGVRELFGAERDAAWSKAVALYPGYVRYQARTPYPIPVMRLSPLHD
jgi:deazaflavin-dependent oxidoreductase (nitroreductase family)